MVDAVGIRGIEVVVGLHGIEGSPDRADAGVGDGADGEPCVGVGVVGADDGLVGIGENLLALRQDVLNGGVDVEAGIALGAEAVVDHRGDEAALRGTIRLLLHQGGHDDDIVHGELSVGNFGFGEAGLFHLGLEVAVELIQGGVHIVGDLVVEVLQELGEHVFGAVVQVELIGVREEVALQAAVVAVVEILEEVIVKLIVGGGLLKLLHGAHALFL